MKHTPKFIAAAFIALTVTSSVSADTISPREAQSRIGDQVTVQGKVTQVTTISSGTTFLNFGGRYPNHVFYGVVFGRDTSKFSGLGSLQGDTVAITGKVKLHKGKPQIIISSPDQLIVE